jgi:hypothetical protein
MGNILLRLEKINRNLYKNVAFRLQAREKPLPASIFQGFFILLLAGIL